ncbi:diguanylate cyclase (GGDEF)-like protein [Microbacterium sp. AK009]|uniref:GGDEF domain-containing protein n=1 Tax=Microbacterium sp. AK009 TaxID=2723068 RepID=UPI0015CBD5B7|nr:GGDEF domain-containing protein [Microbacterium sp. AK009]NYF16651.1 diguanylate cyclase (GGDEF)-like protein [Microbacterium sp. AK009]
MNDGDALPAGVVHLHASGVIASVNDWFAEWISRSRKELVGLALDDVLTYAHDDFFPDGRGPGPWMMLDRRDPGRAVIVSREHSREGQTLLLLEASARWRALRDLRRDHDLADRTSTRLQLLMDSSVAFSTATSEDRLATILADTAGRAYNAEHAAVYLHHPDGRTTLVAGHDPFNGEIDSESLIALVSAPRRTLALSGPDEGESLHPGLAPAMRAAGVHALIATPLHHEEMDFGAFIAWFRHERTFDHEAAPLAEALAGQAAQALATLRLQTRLAFAATHDDVTGLPNRRHLEDQLRAIVGQTACAVLFVDLDRFKEVNDRLGHHAGDRMLREAGRRLLAAVRMQDLVARYGGDEFVIVCPTADVSAAQAIARRVLALLHDGATGRVFGASIGIATAPAGSPSTAEQLIRTADTAMYRAKEAGGNQIMSAVGGPITLTGPVASAPPDVA